MMFEPSATLVSWALISLGAGWVVVSLVMLWRTSRRWRAHDRHWQHEARVQQRVAQLLQQEYEQLLTPEARQRREAVRQHLQALRAQAEAELAAEARPPGAQA